MNDARKPQPRSAVDDDTWEAMAHGELSPEEIGFLRALAEADPTLADHPAAYEPLPAESIERTARAVERSLAAHRRRQRTLRFGGAAGVLAMAAAVLLMVRTADHEGALPAYDLRLSRGVTLERGPAEPNAPALPTFEADTELDIVAVPASSVRESVDARAYLVRGSEIVLLPARFQRSEGGALRWRGPAGTLLRRGPGHYQLAIIVAHALPDEATTRRWVKARDARVLFHDLAYLGPEALLDRRAEAAFAAIEVQRQAGQLAQAEAQLAPLLASADAEVRARALSLRPRLSAAQGAMQRATDELAESTRFSRDAGFDRRALNDGLVRADWLRRKLFRVADAEAALAELEREFAALPGTGALVSYQRALCARDRGDVRRALDALEITQRDAIAEPGSADLRVAAAEVQAPLLSALGRGREADALLRSIAPRVADEPCEQAAYLTNLGWLGLLAEERGEGRADQAALARSYALFTSTCDDASYAQNAAVNLALGALLSGDQVEARRWLDRASEHAAEDPIVASWRIDLEGRLALARGDEDRALSLFGELEARTSVAGQAVDRWRAALGVARAQRARGEHDAARAAYERAEHALDEETLAIPFHAGRETFAGARDASARELAGLLLASKHEREAYEVLRRARARALWHLSLHGRLGQLDPARRDALTVELEHHLRARSALEASQAAAFTAPLDQVEQVNRAAATARDEARAALDRALAIVGAQPSGGALPRPDAYELVLAYFPLDVGWVAFAESPAGLRSVRLGDPTKLAPEHVLDALLTPFARELAAARRLRFLPYGALRDLDLHALPFEGKPLIERIAVVYGADLEPAASRPALGSVVVSDPRGNLRHARDEGRSVTSMLRASGDSVALLEGRNATRDAVAQALGSARLLHVAAHAEGPGTRDRLGAILLAGEDRLEVGDVLALPSVPHEVVLSTCEGALEPGEARVPGLGLAQAFLVRGAESVVASTRRVPDETAQRFALALYQSPAGDLASRSQWAVQQLRAQESASEHWKSYRTWVR